MNKTFTIAAIIAALGLMAGVFSVSTEATYASSSSSSTTTFGFKQKQDNNCSGSATCANTGTITFGGL